MMAYYAKSPPLVLLCAPLPLEGTGGGFHSFAHISSRQSRLLSAFISLPNENGTTVASFTSSSDDREQRHTCSCP